MLFLEKFIIPEKFIHFRWLQPTGRCGIRDSIPENFISEKFIHFRWLQPTGRCGIRDSIPEHYAHSVARFCSRMPANVMLGSLIGVFTKCVKRLRSSGLSTTSRHSHL
ncbi:hypothetical protein SAMN04487996_11953 [Dyadobacter soli]|uniref:Uncharacterized protein n=1 Tax=Dyadobacter soli TaxID=659014 RepID=A0A1G7UPB9_9BACT|nr:hypothetical protein SAMN04487996_11953 [Dyadobacter soli]